MTTSSYTPPFRIGDKVFHITRPMFSSPWNVVRHYSGMDFGKPEQLIVDEVRLVHRHGKAPVWEAMCRLGRDRLGTVYPMANFFGTVEEAQAACDKLNTPK